MEAVSARRNATFLEVPEIAELLGEQRPHREAEDAQELRAVLRLVIERITVDGDLVTVHYRPEAEPWFRAPWHRAGNRLYSRRQTSRVRRSVGLCAVRPQAHQPKTYRRPEAAMPEIAAQHIST